jgi:hypothetical protein
MNILEEVKIYQSRAEIYQSRAKIYQSRAMIICYYLGNRKEGQRLVEWITGWS